MFNRARNFLESKIEDILEKNAAENAVKAAASGTREDLEKYLQKISDRDSSDKCCTEATKAAAANGHGEVVAALMEFFFDKSSKDSCCAEAAWIAAGNQHWNVVTFLVQSISDEQLRDDFCSSYIKAVSENAGTTDETFEDAPALANNDLFNHELIIFLAGTISDGQLKDQYCMDAAESASSHGNMNCVASLGQMISDSDGRDSFCISYAEQSAASNCLEAATSLLRNISNPALRDKKCIDFAESFVLSGSWDIAKSLVELIADPSRRYLCCMKLADLAHSSAQCEDLVFLALTIEDKNMRDQCCLKAVEILADRNEWNEVKTFIEIIDDQSILESSCMITAGAAADTKNWDVVATVGKYIPSSMLLKDEYWRSATETVAEKMDIRRLNEFLVSTASKAGVGVSSDFYSSSSDGTAVAAIPADWLLRNSPLLKLLSQHLEIPGDDSVLRYTLSKMHAVRIAQLLCLSITHSLVALALTIIRSQYYSDTHVDQQNSTGATALMLAADAGQHDVINELLLHGASVRAVDGQGRTALSRACIAGHVLSAKVLINEGADPSHQDHQGMTCEQLANQYHNYQVLPVLQNGTSENTTMDVLRQQTRNRELSRSWHQQLTQAGFSLRRAKCQQVLGRTLQTLVQSSSDGQRQMTGSYREGWGNSLVQVNGRVGAQSDIDWTTMDSRQVTHLKGGCQRSENCKNSPLLQVREGHAQVQAGSGSQPAMTTLASGVRPTEDICEAIQCCSDFCQDRIAKLLPNRDLPPVHLVRATRPNSPNELRVSFSFHEKEILESVSEVQGQLFVILKYIFKIYMPINLQTPGLKTYHAKTLLLFMLEKQGKDSSVWHSVENLVDLLNESLDTMLSFVASGSSPDVCMPHFFMPDAPLYFKNAGVGGDLVNTRTKVSDQLREIRSNIRQVYEAMKEQMMSLQSEDFYFHPFTLLPLARKVEKPFQATQPADSSIAVYCMVNQCMVDLQSEATDKDELMEQLNILDQLQWCKCAVLCMKVMAHLKSEDSAQADILLKKLQSHQVQRGWKPENLLSKDFFDIEEDWAWRFCLPCDSPPRLPFLPEFTQTLLKARLSQPGSAHLYVNFRCLSWSLQAELLRDLPIDIFDEWRVELQEDPDLEELLTLAHYSQSLEHWEFCRHQIETIISEKRVTLDGDELRLVLDKLSPNK